MKSLTACLLFIMFLAGGPVPASADDGVQWRRLQAGMDYAEFRIEAAAGIGDRTLHVVRVDPRKTKPVAILASEGDKKARTAGRWCEEGKLAVAINLGMFDTDRLTNIGYLRHGLHMNSRSWKSKFKSVLAFNPKAKGLPPVILVDLPYSKRNLADYKTVVQNLRLIKSSGENVWKGKGKRWSEAAVAMDREGKLLFLFCRTPLSMQEFNDMVLNLPLGIVRAMHMDGGPQASLSIHAGGVDLDLYGSYETDFPPFDLNIKQWPIPNVLGVEKAH